MNEFDVLVVGAGIAGCATALELVSAGWRVGILHQHDNAPGMESLPPNLGRKLDALATNIGSSFCEVVAWWGSERPACEAHLGARIVERTELASAFRGHVFEHGVTAIKNGRVLDIERFHDGWGLKYKAPRGDNRTLTANYLVDATGRASVLGRRLGSRRVIFDDLFCISVPLDQPNFVGTWTESTFDGWWNLCCIRERGMLSFFSTARTIREVRSDIASCFYRTRHLHRLLPTPRFGNSIVRCCCSSLLIPCAGPGWVSIGDAVSTFHPLASAGVSKAFRDARMIRGALEQKPADYHRLKAAEFRVYLEQLRQQYAVEKRWQESPFWASYLTPFEFQTNLAYYRVKGGSNGYDARSRSCS